MLPPAMLGPGALAQEAPVSAPSSRAMAAKASMTSGRRGSRPRLRQLREPFALAAQEWAETQAIVELSERRQVRQPPTQRAGARAEREIAGDARELAREVHGLPVCGEARAESARAAQRQGRDARKVGVQLIERGECLHQYRRRAVPDSRHTRNVVAAVAGERQIVGEPLG